MTQSSPFEIRQPAEELKLVQEFQQRAVLSSILLKEFHARSGSPSGDKETRLRLDLEHEVRRSQVVDNTAQFDVALTIKALLVGQTDQPLFEIEGCFEVGYILHPDFLPSEDHLADFKKGNVLFHCWPYLRELIHNTTWRMGLFVPPLPLLRVIPEGATRSGRGSSKKAVAATKRATKTNA